MSAVPAAPPSPERLTCPACGSSESSFSLPIREYRYRGCRECRTLYLPRPVAAGQIYEDAAYFHNPAFGESESGGYFGYWNYIADREHIERKFGDLLARAEVHLAPGRLLDVGAGPGFLLAVAARRGWDATGIDPNPWAVRFAAEIGVDVRHGALDDGALVGPFDLITLNDVLEHVFEPGEMLEQAVRLLRPGGLVAVVTPDAGAVLARVLRSRWPEAQRVPEHQVLLSGQGLALLLRRHGLDVLERKTIGKHSTIRTLTADVAPAAPRLVAAARKALLSAGLGDVAITMNPRTKLFVLARRGSPEPLESVVRDTIRADLGKLARARRFCDWTFARCRVQGTIGTEVGAGIGTFSSRLLDQGVRDLLLIEPEPDLAEALQRRFAEDRRVCVAAESVPDSPALAAQAGTLDFVLCQNVLEHVDDDRTAFASMAAALRPGGVLTVTVPAHPALFNSLDRHYGHRRRYTRAQLRSLAEGAGLEVVELAPFNLLAIPGWWLAGRLGSRELDSTAVKAFDAAVPFWRMVEDRLKPPFGLSFVLRARRPEPAP